MTFVLAGVIAALLLYMMWMQLRIEDEREAWAKERRELLNRIQHPQIVPREPTGDFQVPDREHDEWNLVGNVDLSEPGDDG